MNTVNKKVLLILIAVVLTVFFFVLKLAGSSTRDNTTSSYLNTSSTDISAEIPVPFTYFDTENYLLIYKFNVSKTSGSLYIFDRPYELPKNNLLLKVLELDTHGKLLLIQKKLFGGEIELGILDINSQKYTPIPLSDSFNNYIFRQAATYDSDIILLLYNVLDNKNYLFELLDSAEGYVLNFPTGKELFFGGRYEISDNILTAIKGETKYFCSSKACFGVKKEEGKYTILKLEIKEDVKLIELVSDTHKVFGLYQNNDGVYEIGHVDEDKITLAPVERQIYGLRIENGKLTYSVVSEIPDLLQLFLADMRFMQNSGLMDFGSNNYEGRVAWSQVYYLNAFIDVLSSELNDFVPFPLNDQVKKDMRIRLDMEMFLMDRLLNDDSVGILSKRYTTNRQPAVHAVQSGRILRLFKRYIREIPDPIELKNFKKLEVMTTNLDGHIEQFTQAAVDGYIPKGSWYMEFPKGCDFPFDGVELPYNHMDDWVSGVAYGESDVNKDYLDKAHDIIRTLISIEKLDTEPPKDFKWHYWWGQAKEGWDSDQKISKNKVNYEGDKSIAHISYRTIDAMAVLELGHIFDDVLHNGKLINYFKEGVERGDLYLFVSEGLARYNELPKPPTNVLNKYIRLSSPWELQNAVWAMGFYNHYYGSNLTNFRY